MLSIDNYWQKIQESILKIRQSDNTSLKLILLLLSLSYTINQDSIKSYIEIYLNEMNFLLGIAIMAIIVIKLLNSFKTHKRFKTLIITALLAIFLIATFYTYDFYHTPQPPEDKLVVAISPFYYIDESGKIGSDINTATDFKEKLEATKNLELEIKMLDEPILDVESAKSQGEKAGAHVVIYGETKSKIGNIGEVKYYIYPLPIISETMPLMHLDNLDGTGIITEKVTFSIVTNESITIKESLNEKASSTIYFIGALEKYRNANFISAITSFKSIKNYENNSLILFYIGASYSFNNDVENALLFFDKTLEINPQFPEVWYNKGVIFWYQGKSKEALEASDNAIRISPQYAEAWSNKGAYLGRLGKNEEAVEAFDIATKINPQYTDAWLNKGITLGHLERNEEALEAFEKIIEINPEYLMAWYNKGVVLNRLGRNEEALEAYDKAIKINPQLSEAWFNKGGILSALGKNEDALYALDEVIEINQKFVAEAWSNKGVRLGNMGRYEEALEAFDKAIEINPQLAEAWANRRVLLGKMMAQGDI